MEKNLRINYLGIEIYRGILSDIIKSDFGLSYDRLTYTQALNLGLIEGNKNGWRLPKIKEWRFLSSLDFLGIISLSEQFYYLTSETTKEYIPEEIRDQDEEIQQILSEDPFALDDSGIDQIYVWDPKEKEKWEQYDGNDFNYILIRDLKS